MRSLLVTYLTVICLLFSCQSATQNTELSTDNKIINEASNKKEVPKHIGLIPYDALIDTLDFEVCDENTITPYFHHLDLSFAGEKPALVSNYKEQFKASKTSENGYITIRFIVNCKGKTGRFRIIEMDENYELKNFSEATVNQFYDITQSLEGWDILKQNNRALDYVRYITFNIQNGELKDILP